MTSRRSASLRVLVAGALALVTACSSSIAGTAVTAAGRKATAVSTASTSTAASTGTSTGPSSSSAPPSPSRSAITSGQTSVEVPDDGPVVPRPPDEQAPDGVGTEGIGDDYYPGSGNGGYDVHSYAIDLDYVPETNRLTATTTVGLTVTSADALRRFNFDLQPSMEVSAVEVDGRRWAHRQQGSELQITPTTPLATGTEISIAVAYTGEPATISEGTAGLGDGGWYRTRSGGALVAGQPFSASAWYPVNEHPADPATYTVDVTVPEKWSVISNGSQIAGGADAPAGKRVSRWEQAVPIASYLVTLYIDTFDLEKATSDSGIPVLSALAPGNAGDRALHRQTGNVVDALVKHFGPYPYGSVGGIYSDESIPFALETATRPVYADWVDLDTVVHELAHQWYGDDVMVQRWRDICLNECFASYAPWLWHQDTDDADLDAEWKDQMATVGQDPQFWASPLVDMGAGQEFTAVYTRGPLAVHVLRKTMGEKAFADLLLAWPETYGGGTATFEDLETLASEIAGKNLDDVFGVWFRASTPPSDDDYPAALR